MILVHGFSSCIHESEMFLPTSPSSVQFGQTQLLWEMKANESYLRAYELYTGDKKYFFCQEDYRKNNTILHLQALTSVNNVK
jgi:hypothetical protein